MNECLKYIVLRNILWKNDKVIRVCLVTIYIFFSIFSVFKNNILFLRLKNLFDNPN